jgi:RNA-directed DNA polymerase
MGKRSAVVELFLGDMGSIQRELRPSTQREDQLTMETKLEQIAVKARREPNLRFTSLAHHITRDRVLENLGFRSDPQPGWMVRLWRRRRRASRGG